MLVLRSSSISVPRARRGANDAATGVRVPRARACASTDASACAATRLIVFWNLCKYF